MQASPLPEDNKAYTDLSKHMKSCKLVCQNGDIDFSGKASVNNKKYKLLKNTMNIEWFKLVFNNDTGIFEFKKDGVVRKIEFGLCKNVSGYFPGDKRNSDIASKLTDGQYSCAASAAWTSKNNFVIKVQIIDVYFGCLNIHFGFKDNRVTLLCKKSGQYVLDDYSGYAVGIAED